MPEQNYKTTAFSVVFETRWDQPNPTEAEVVQALRTLSPWAWRDDISGPGNERPRMRLKVAAMREP